MRLIVLMVVVLIVGLLTLQQMAPKDEPSVSTEPHDAAEDSTIPAVPTRPNEIKQFSQDMDQYIQDEMAKRVEAMEAATKQ
ncbi:hypothetical protein EH243_08015 [Amphritea opalescens]|uniref:Uncharacterized protein n=1 Tax=Amphritea opalescens TaxID=2490544 RepID=A0A430KRE3_9GAMM|nr:hypothetical protein [Amphritea opalescens]RTE66065.1 hypothetical protein EH243_08015 [Amphritea opalescens]